MKIWEQEASLGHVWQLAKMIISCKLEKSSISLIVSSPQMRVKMKFSMSVPETQYQDVSEATMRLSQRMARQVVARLTQWGQGLLTVQMNLKSVLSQESFNLYLRNSIGKENSHHFLNSPSKYLSQNSTMRNCMIFQTLV